MHIFMLVVIAVVTITFNKLYHRLFHVIYFSLWAVLTEWFICFLLAFYIVAGIFGALGLM